MGKFDGFVDNGIGMVIRGWAVNLDDRHDLPTIFVCVDGEVVDSMVPWLHRPDVAAMHGMPGLDGFAWRMPEHLLEQHKLVEFVLPDGTRLGPSPGAEGLEYVKQDLVRSTKFEPLDGLIFLHLSKCGGTSLRNIFVDSFAEDEIAFLYPDPPGMSRKHFLALTPQQRAKFVCIFGHEYYGVHSVLAGNWRYATTVRDPIERLWSQYHHHHRTIQAASSNSEPPTFTELLESNTRVEFDNYMTRVLAGTDTGTIPVGQLDESIVELALDNVENHFEWVGFLEHNFTRRRNLEKLLGRPIAGIPFDGSRQEQVTQMTMDDRKAAYRFNRLDILLYSKLLTRHFKNLEKAG